jgi:rhombotail lipoprotein
MKPRFPIRLLIAALIAALLAGCAPWVTRSDRKQRASMVEYLFPNDKDAKMTPDARTTLRLPLRVGIAFAPGAGWGGTLAEADRVRLLGRVKDAFANQPFISAIEVIPSSYLLPRGGFANLEQVARMFNVDVVALVSYDQVQFNDSNAFSLLYWTIVGAYVIQGDRYDVNTMLDASVFDVRSRKLLFRAPGVSQIKGSATMAGFSERSREARNAGFDKALDNLIPAVHAQLEDFRQRVREGKETSVRVEHSPGYQGGGDLSGIGTAAALLLLFGLRRARPHAA